MLSRRQLAMGGLTLSLAPATRAQGADFPRPGHPGRRMTIRGKQIYVEDTGPRDAPVVVYLHGGPGTGSYYFGLYQTERLSRRLRLIQFDQRGALRSESVVPDEPFTIDDLVEDTEALRIALGVPRWHVLSHSFAGLIAVRYGLAYPDAVQSQIFDNVSFDIPASNQEQARAFADIYRSQGKPEAAALAEQFASELFDGMESFRKFNRLANGLGFEARMRSFVHSLPDGYFMDWVTRSGLDIADWAKGGEATAAIWRSGDGFIDMTRRLAELRPPAVLLKGRHDHNTSQTQIDAFRAANLGPVVMFEQSGHMPHAEEPDRYADVVDHFIREVGLKALEPGR